MNRGRLLDHETEGAQLAGVHGEGAGTVEDSYRQHFCGPQELPFFQPDLSCGGDRSTMRL